MRLLVPIAFALISACVCQPFEAFDAGYFACNTRTDCAPRFDCIGGVCRPEGSGGFSGGGGRAGGAGGGGGGGGGLPETGGGGEAGGGEAGGMGGGGTAGGGTSGGGTAGGGTAGGGTAGGGTAGGGTAGGGTAGGGTAGGGTAGGGTAGGGTAGGGAAGGGAMMNRLVVIAGPNQSVVANACSSGPVTVEVRNAAMVPQVQTSGLTVNLSVAPVGLQFFTGAGCASATAIAVITPGNSAASFWFKSAIPNAYTVSMNSPGLMGTSTTETVFAQTATKLVFTSAAQSNVGAGACRAITVQQQDGASMPVVAGGNVPVMLSATPAAISKVQFFPTTSPTCTGAPVTSVPIVAGQSSVTLYASAWTGTTYQITASSSGLTPTTQSFMVRPIVRSGTCLLDVSTASRLCQIPPPVQMDITKTALFFQAKSNGGPLDRIAVRCDLTGANAIFCRRVTTGLDVTIYWQTLEMDTGLTVQRTTANCPDDGGTTAFVPFAGGAGNFILTSQSTDSLALDPTTIYTGERTAGGVTLEWQQPCVAGPAGYVVSVQLVAMNGVVSQAQRGAIASGSLSSQASLATSSGAPFVLSTQMLTSSGTTELCSRAVRVESTGAGLNFSRGNGSSSPACSDENMTRISAERVWVPTTVGQVDTFTTSMLQGDATASIALSRAVDVTRTIAFSSNQFAGGGQGAGESALNSGNTLGDAIAAHTLVGGADFSASQLFLERGSTQGAGKWTSYVVEIGPP